jgi:hypothetical protein
MKIEIYRKFSKVKEKTPLFCLHYSVASGSFGLIFLWDEDPSPN